MARTETAQLVFKLTPEERQILGITEEDIASFSDEGMQLTPVEIEAAIADMIADAYEGSPVFKRLVDADAAQDPDHLGRSAKVVSKFLKHLRGVLPPERASAIKADAFDQAHDMVRDVLHGKVQRKTAPAEVSEPVIGPLSDDDLSLFGGVKRESLTARTTWGDVERAVLFFLGRLKDGEGKTIKNESTAKMPDDLKISTLARFLYDIRAKKLQVSGRLSPADERWLGKTPTQVLQIARALVVRSPGKEEPVYQNDMIEVQRQAGEVVSQINRLQDMFRDPKFTASIRAMTDVIDTALPSASLFEDRIRSIQEEIGRLGLSKSQASVLTTVDPDTLSYTDPVKKVLEEQRVALQGVMKKISEAGSTPDLEAKKKNIEKQIVQLEVLGSKDVSGLRQAIEEYLGTLRAYKEHIKKNLIDKRIDQPLVMGDFIRMVDDMALTFGRLMREQRLKAKWSGRSGFMFRGEGKTSVPEGAPDVAPAPVVKEAADAAGYASKIEQFRGKGLGDAYREIADIMESEDKLPAIKDKLLSVMEVRPGTQWDDSGKDYTGDPEGGKGMTVEDAASLVGKLRTLVKRIKIGDKGAEATDILKWAATLQDHIKGSGSKALSMKKADAVYALRKLAAMILGEDGKKKHMTYQSPSGTGSDRPYREPGKAGWLLYRERMTKLGKKALRSLFEEPTFVQDFVSEMERAGLSTMLLHGGEVKAADVDRVLEGVVQKATGKKGDIGDILTGKVMQEYGARHDVKEVNKEAIETQARVEELNKKITETESKYLPKLEQFAKFIKDPIGMVREQLELLRGTGAGKKEKDMPVDEGKMDTVTPDKIDARTFQTSLRRIFDRYVPEDIARSVLYPKGTATAKKASIRKRAFLETSKMLPREFYKQYLVYGKRLKNLKAKMDGETDALKRAKVLKDYYETVLGVGGKLSEFFEYQGRVLDADRETMSRIEAFLDSGESKRVHPDVLQKSRKMITGFQKYYDEERKRFDDLKKRHADIDSVRSLAKKQYDQVVSDLEDGRADAIYQVAISPELTPSKERAREIKERAREHEKGLSYIIDRSTYKNNMNRLMTFKLKRGPAVSYPGEGVKVLPPERKKDLETILKSFEDRIRQMKEIADSGMREVALKKMEEDLSKAKASLAGGTKLIEDYTALIQNIEFLSVNKDKMDPAEYKTQVDALNDILKTLQIFHEDIPRDVKTDKNSLKKDIENEKIYLDRVQDHIDQLEGGVLEKARKEFETGRPAVDVVKRVELMHQKLYQLKLLDQPSMLKPKPPQEQLKLMEDKIKQMEELGKVPVEVVPGTPGERAYKKFIGELEHSLDVSKRDLEEFKKKQPGASGVVQPGAPMGKTAAIEDTMPDLSPYERALETKGLKAAPYMEELKKPKGWEIVEEFFTNVKREHTLLKSKIEEGKVSPLRTDFVKARLDQLEGMTEAIDGYKNQLLNIGGDQVAFRDIMMDFEDTLDEYEQTLRKYINQRDDAVTRLESLKQERDHLNELFDKDTGEFKGLDPEEVKNIKGIFLRMLYRDLESYWGSNVGKNLSVFGDRDTEWYNNVYRTFKNLAQTRSNRKMLGILNKYKQETRSDFDDIINRFKSEDLQKRLDALVKRYKEMGGDPDKSETIKTLVTRIDTLKKQEKQMDKIFREMASTSLAQLDAEIQKSLAERVRSAPVVEGEKPIAEKPKGDLDKMVEVGIDRVVDEFEKELGGLIEAQKSLAQVETLLGAGEKKLQITPETTGTPERVKVAYDKTHRDFNLNILYSACMQDKIAEMMSEK
jgi:hypothetical protein